MAQEASGRRELPAITTSSDTRDVLDHARRESDAKGFGDFLIVDIDAHVTEGGSWREVTDYIPSDVYRQMAKSFEERAGSPAGLLAGQGGIAYQDVNGRIIHDTNRLETIEDSTLHRQAALQRRAMDSMGIDYMVVFPTQMLTLGLHPQAEVEVELAWAYNRWLVERVVGEDPGLMGLLYLPFNTPEALPGIIEEFGDKKGVAGFTSTSVRYRAVHHNSYMRTYAMLEERGIPMCFHAAFNWGDGSMAQLNRFLSMHALSFVHCNLIHLTNWVINGLPERFPKLDVLWIESGLAWLPYLMQRLDSEYMMRSSEAPLLKRRPSEYIKDMYFSSQPMETQHPKLVEATFEAINAETQLLWCSDWPHWDFDTPSVIWDLPFFDEEAKKNILGRNAARLFNLPNPYERQEAAE